MERNREKGLRKKWDARTGGLGLNSTTLKVYFGQSGRKEQMDRNKTENVCVYICKERERDVTNNETCRKKSYKYDACMCVCIHIMHTYQ